MSPRLFTGLLATQSDERLAELVTAGHERAFDAVARRYHRSLLRYCSHLGLSDGRAEDVVQQALLQAWIALRRGVVVREVRAWLYRIVHNTAINALRRAPDALAVVSDAESDGSTPAVEVDFEQRMALRDALRGVAALPSMQRDAMLLSTLEGRSYDEVASALGITEGAVRGLLYRARAALRDAAAALTPMPLIAWACGAASKSAPAAARVAELSTSGAGAAESTGLLVKGAAIAVSTAALVTGAAEVRSHDHNSHRAAHHPHATTASVPVLPSPEASPVVGSSAHIVVTHAHVSRKRVASSHSATTQTSAAELIAIVPTTTSPRRARARQPAVTVKPAPSTGAEGGTTSTPHPTHVSAPAIVASVVNTSSESSTKSGSGQTPPDSGHRSSGGSRTGSGSGSSGGGSPGKSSKPGEKSGGSQKDDGPEGKVSGSEKDDGGSGGGDRSKEPEAEKPREKSGTGSTGSDDSSHETEKTSSGGSSSPEKELEPKTGEKPDS